MVPSQSEGRRAWAAGQMSLQPHCTSENLVTWPELAVGKAAQRSLRKRGGEVWSVYVSTLVSPCQVLSAAEQWFLRGSPRPGTYLKIRVLSSDFTHECYTSSENFILK